jgi:hypothetical protein
MYSVREVEIISYVLNIIARSLTSYFNPLKNDTNLNYFRHFIPHRTPSVTITRSDRLKLYRKILVTVVVTRNIYVLCDKMQSFLMLQQVVHIITTIFYVVN